MARPTTWTNDKEGKKAMYKDLKGIKVRGGGDYTGFMKSSRRHDAKHNALMAKVDAPNSKGLDIKR